MKKIDISGSPFEIGLRLGELGREAWHQKLMLTSLWQTVMTLQASPETRLMRTEVQRHYPLILPCFRNNSGALGFPYNR